MMLMLRGKPEGIQTVLTERGLWPAERIRLVCTQCSGKMERDPNRRARYKTNSVIANQTF